MYEVLNSYLENGLKIIIHKIPNSKTVASGLWIRQGSVYEDDQNNGLSHLVEHLLLNAANEECPEYHSYMEQAVAEGVVYNAATTKEYTCFYFTGLARTMELCLSCLSCIAKDGRTFPSDFFEKEKNVVLQEATSYYSSFQQIKERMSQALWGSVGTGRIIMGSIANITNASVDQINTIIDEAYVPENATVIVIGNVDYDEVLSVIDKKFSDWMDRRSSQRQELIESVPGIYYNPGNGNNTVLSIGFRGPAYSDTYRAATDMLVRITGYSGMQSRMLQEVRIKRGLAYTVGGFSSFYRNRGTIGFLSVCNKEKTTEVSEVMMDVLQKIRENGFSEEEIEREKRVMETSLLLEVDNITEHLRYIGKCSEMASDFYIENEIRHIRQLDGSELNTAIEQILTEDNMGLAAIGECDFDKLLETVAFT